MGISASSQSVMAGARNGKTMRSRWRCGGNPNLEESECIAINRQGIELRKFVEDFLPKFNEILKWDPNVTYSLKKRGRWRILQEVEFAWQQQADCLAGKDFDIEIGDLRCLEPMEDVYYRALLLQSRGSVGARKIYRNHGQIVNKENLKGKWIEGDREKVEIKRSKKLKVANMKYTNLQEEREHTRKISIVIANKGANNGRKSKKKIMRCHESDKYTRRLDRDLRTKTYKHISFDQGDTNIEVQLYEPEICEFLCEREALSVDVNSILKRRSQKQT